MGRTALGITPTEDLPDAFCVGVSSVDLTLLEICSGWPIVIEGAGSFLEFFPDSSDVFSEFCLGGSVDFFCTPSVVNSVDVDAGDSDRKVGLG
jgi:hypothetical protein